MQDCSISKAVRNMCDGFLIGDARMSLTFRQVNNLVRENLRILKGSELEIQETDG